MQLQLLENDVAIDPTPQWVSFFLDAGRWMARNRSREYENCLTFLCPSTRSASHLLALGFLLECSCLENGTTSVIDWMQFSELPNGTLITRKKLECEDR